MEQVRVLFYGYISLGRSDVINLILGRDPKNRLSTAARASFIEIHSNWVVAVELVRCATKANNRR